MKLTNKKALLVGVLIGIVIIFSIYWYSTTQTQKINFDMNGTFQIVYKPCPQNTVNCNPWDALVLDNGGFYELLFNSTTELPNTGQHIRVIGNVTYNHVGVCFANGRETPCNPIGRVTVSSWRDVPIKAGQHIEVRGNVITNNQRMY